ncbi:hypothetical protein PsYK624_045950 [Phanerochaete sordida]|uniref:Uncharacterized protein n=1 Tax=Phanerochaete sordida TaxID=48140 RepID=A0A9P3LC49_9APHY|nr:hypothetical protein PsYK624_045950 [Phanerochaete sordida]
MKPLRLNRNWRGLQMLAGVTLFATRPVPPPFTPPPSRGSRLQASRLLRILQRKTRLETGHAVTLRHLAARLDINRAVAIKHLAARFVEGLRLRVQSGRRGSTLVAPSRSSIWRRNSSRACAVALSRGGAARQGPAPSRPARAAQLDVGLRRRVQASGGAVRRRPAPSRSVRAARLDVGRAVAIKHLAARFVEGLRVQPGQRSSTLACAFAFSQGGAARQGPAPSRSARAAQLDVDRAVAIKHLAARFVEGLRVQLGRRSSSKACAFAFSQGGTARRRPALSRSARAARLGPAPPRLVRAARIDMDLPVHHHIRLVTSYRLWLYVFVIVSRRPCVTSKYMCISIYEFVQKVLHLSITDTGSH